MSAQMNLLRTQTLLAAGRRYVPVLQVLVAALSLMGISFLLWFYTYQNAQVAEAFDEVVGQREMDDPLHPLELAELAHQTCVLNVEITNIQSFLQPLGATLSGGGWCGNYVRVFSRFAATQGYPVHKFHIQSGGRSHTLAEVYYQGKWRIIDPFFNLGYLTPSGEMATFEDIKANPSLLELPHKGGLDDPRLERIYNKYVPIFPDLYAGAPDFYPSTDRSAFYHNAYVFLSYPLDPFYEGERRPIMPMWLDRPELLGVYVLSGVFLAAVAPFAVGRFREIQRRHRNQV